MTLARWEPFTDLASVKSTLDRFFEEAFGPRRWRLEDAGARVLPLNMYETDDHVIVKALVPGVSPDDVNVTIEQGNLTIRARRPEPATHDNARFFYHEVWGGEFVRSVTLPSGLEEDKAEASFEHGVLTLTIPKTAEARPRQIKVKTVKSK